MPELTLVMASANPDKAAEIAAILAAVPGLTLVPRPADVPDVEETGDTLEDNARLKARALCEATGLAAVADDTGLEVDALDGAPGVYSARFAGEGATYADNVAKMLAELDRVGRRPTRRPAGPVPERGLRGLPRRHRAVGGGRGGRDDHHRGPGRRAGSGTTRSSPPTASTAGPSPR